MGGHTKYFGTQGNLLTVANVAPTQTEFHNHSKEENTMTKSTANTTAANTTTNTAEAADLNTVVEPVVEAPAAAPAAAAEPAEGKLKAVKSSMGSSSFAWESVIGAGTVGAIGSLTAMIVSNRLNSEFKPEDGRQYSILEMAGVSAVTGLVAAGLQAGVQQIESVNESDNARLMSTSLIANGSAIASMMLRDRVLDMFGSSKVSMADYITEDEVNAAQ